MESLRAKLRRFGLADDGAGTVLGLYIFCVMLMAFGLAIDVANTWRNRTALTSTADIAAHAGAVAIAYHKSKDQIKTDVVNAIEANLPAADWGNMIHVDTDVHFGEYDAKKFGWDSVDGSDYNGVIVGLHRTRAYGNPVSTFVMRLMGIKNLEVSARSAAVFADNGDCNLNDGVYAEGNVSISTQAHVGSGYCLSSNTQVWLSQQNEFDSNTMVTMPNLADCKNKCTDSANPGIRARPAHLIFPDIRQHILDTWDAFIQPGIPASGVKYTWYTKDVNKDGTPDITLGNVAALQAYLGLSTPPALGDVIPMTWDQFMNYAQPLPAGLVYHVSCQKGGKFGQLVFDGTHGQMDGGVLLTECKILFDTGSKITKSIVITTADTSTAVISANQGTTMGDPTNSCGATDRSIIMAIGPVSVPSDFTMSNLTLIVDGDVNVAAMSNGSNVVNTTSYGFAVYSSQQVSFASNQTFESCGNTTTFLTPEIKILRIVVPPMVNADGSFNTSTFLGDSTLNLGNQITLSPTSGSGSGAGTSTIY